MNAKNAISFQHNRGFTNLHISYIYCIPFIIGRGQLIIILSNKTTFFVI
jgi:hypothetical protein